MVNRVFHKHGFNFSGAVDYVLDNELHDGKATLIRGDADLTRQVILANHRKRKYISGVLSFSENNLSAKKINKIITLFHQTFLPGITINQFAPLWVGHLDKNRQELHYIIGTTELQTGKSLAVYVPYRDFKKNDLFESYINAKYNLKAPKAKDSYITFKDKDNEGATISILRSDTKALKRELEKEIERHSKDNLKRYSTGKFESVENQDEIPKKNPNKGKRNDIIRTKIDGLTRRKIERIQRSIESTANRTAEWTESTQRAKQLNNKAAIDAYKRGRQRRRSNEFVKKIGGDISGLFDRVFADIRRKTSLWFQQLAIQEKNRIKKVKKERETEEEMKNYHVYDIDSQSVLTWLENQNFDEDDPFMDNAPMYSDDILEIKNDDLDTSKDEDIIDETIQADQKKSKKKKRKIQKP